MAAASRWIADRRASALSHSMCIEPMATAPPSPLSTAVAHAARRVIIMIPLAIGRAMRR